MKSHELARLTSSGPARTIGTSRRALTGRVNMCTGGVASFESSLERDWLIAVDFDYCSIQVKEQPFSIHYMVNNKPRRYTPDLLVEYHRQRQSSNVVVYEVKPLAVLRANWAKFRPRFKEAVRYCRERGWRFKIVTEKHIRTPFVENAKFLRRYRNLVEQKLFKDQILYTLKALGETTPQALLAAAYLHEEKRMAALPELWRLVASRQIGALLNEPLTMQSPIWLPDAES